MTYLWPFWHANDLFDMFVQIKVLPAQHNCPTTKLREGKMASQGWSADRLADWVKKNQIRAQRMPKTNWRVTMELSWSTLKFGQVALDQIHVSYEKSFQLLFNWAAQIEISSPGSIVKNRIRDNRWTENVQKDICCSEAMQWWVLSWLQTIYWFRWF